MSNDMSSEVYIYTYIFFMHVHSVYGVGVGK